MKKMKDFHDFEERLKTDYEGMNLENKQHIIQNIIRPTKQKHKAKKLSIGLIASLCLLLAVATAGAMEYTSLTFFKGSGNTVIEVTNIKEEDMEPHTNADEISRKNEKLMEELKKTIPEGKFLYFMDTEAYEQSGIFNLFYLSNPDSTAIKKVEELPSSITQYIHLENTLLENYHLKRGMFLYDLPDTDHDQMMKIIEKLQRQAMEQNRHYGIMQGDLLDEVRSVTLRYETDNFPDWEAFDLEIDAINTRVETTENLSNYAPLNNELGIEMYYSEEERTLRFVMQTSAQNYLITIRNPIISDENVDVQRFIDVAESLMVQQ